MNRPDSKASVKPRRSFSADYKQRILREATTTRARGALTALLAREGLYASHLTAWRLQAERGELAALEPKQRGPKSAVDPNGRRIAELERELARLSGRMLRAEAALARYREGREEPGASRATTSVAEEAR